MDRGPGIAEEHLPHLFKRYWRARDGAYKGTGLGLFITKSIIEAHGGGIEVASRPGEGASFTIELPRRGSHYSAADARVVRSATRGTSRALAFSE